MLSVFANVGARGWGRGGALPVVVLSRRFRLGVVEACSSLRAQWSRANTHLVDGVGTALGEGYKIKCGVLGPDPGDVREVQILNNIIRPTTQGYDVEVDPRHAQLVSKEMELKGASRRARQASRTTPARKQS